MAVELLTHLVLHEFHQLVLDALALRLGRNVLALGGVLAFQGVIVLGGRFAAGKVLGQQAVHHHVRIAADGGGEVRIVGEGQAVMADVFRGVAGFGHGAQGQDLDGGQLRLVLGVFHEAVERFGNVFAVLDGAHFVAKMRGEVLQAAQLFHIGEVVDAVHKGFLGFGHIFRYAAVGKKHEFLNEPVGFLGEFLVHAYGLAVRGHLHFHLRAFEVYGAGLEAFGAELGGQPVKGENGLLDGCRHVFRFFAFDDGLGAFIVEPVIRDNFRAAEPGVQDLGLRRKLKYGGEGEFFLVRAQGAQFVGEFLRQHGHSTVHQVHGGATGLGLFVHLRAGVHVVGDIGNVDAHLEVPVFQLAKAQGIVKVLGVCGVDGEGEHLAEVFAAFAVLGRDDVRDLVRGVFYVFLEAVGEAELRQDGMHFGLVLAGHAQDVHHMAVGAVGAALPTVYDGGHLHAALGAFGDGHFNVIGHGFGAHEHPGLLAHRVQDANERTVGAFHNGDDFAAAPFGVAGFLLRHGHTHGVSVQGPAGFGGLHIDVLLLALNAYKDKPFP